MRVVISPAVTTPMLHATPRSMFSWDFTIRRDDEPVAEVDMAWIRERAEVSIAGQTYVFSRESMPRGTFALRVGGQVLVSARKVSVFARAFEVELGRQRLALRAVWFWGREFGLFDGADRIGGIRPTGWPGRSAVIELPDDIALPEQVFLFWLVAVSWRRAANAAAARA